MMLRAGEACHFDRLEVSLYIGRLVAGASIIENSSPWSGSVVSSKRGSSSISSRAKPKPPSSTGFDASSLNSAKLSSTSAASISSVNLFETLLSISGKGATKLVARVMVLVSPLSTPIFRDEPALALIQFLHSSSISLRCCRYWRFKSALYSFKDSSHAFWYSAKTFGLLARILAASLSGTLRLTCPCSRSVPCVRTEVSDFFTSFS